MISFESYFFEHVNGNSIDVEYFNAIEQNDLEKVKQLVDIAAKSAGYNVGPVYHGTPTGGFDKFRVGKNFGPLFFFAKEEKYANYYANRFKGSPNPQVMSLYLRMENPLRVNEFEPTEGVKEAYKIRKMGYDSVETPNAHIVFLPDQIKSADLITKKNGKIVPLSKRFNMDSDLIFEYRHNLADGTPAPSIQAHNGKNPNSINKKKLHTVGPYKPKQMAAHRPGQVLSGAVLDGFLRDYNLEFKAGEVSKIKNSPHAIEMYVNPATRVPTGRIIQR